MVVDRDKPCYLTPAGKQALVQELEELRTVRRPALAESIRQLNGFGGFSETELDDLMSEQTQLDAHIRDIEFMLRHAILIEEGTRRGDRVELGSQVAVVDGSGEEIHWTIVGSAEAHARQGKISNESPIGASLLGHGPGEVVTVLTPGGPQQYTIVKIL